MLLNLNSASLEPQPIRRNGFTGLHIADAPIILRLPLRLEVGKQVCYRGDIPVTDDVLETGILYEIESMMQHETFVKLKGHPSWWYSIRLFDVIW